MSVGYQPCCNIAGQYLRTCNNASLDVRKPHLVLSVLDFTGIGSVSIIELSPTLRTMCIYVVHWNIFMINKRDLQKQN